MQLQKPVPHRCNVKSMPHTGITVRWLSTPAGRLRAENAPTLEFHVLKSARDRYGISDTLFSASGNLIFLNFHAVRLLAQKMNERRDLRRSPELAVRAGHLNLMGLIDEIYHYLVHLYEATVNPRVFERALSRMGKTIGRKEMEKALAAFTRLYPPTSVYRKRETVGKYLKRASAGRTNQEILLEEFIHTWFLNRNPAVRAYRELFDDEGISSASKYPAIVEKLEEFFREQEKFGPKNEDLFALFRGPVEAHPNDLEAQLEYLRATWGMLLPEDFLTRIARAGDFLREEQRAVRGGGPGPTRVPKYDNVDEYGYLEFDEERFTPDSDWMPNVVLLAKNTYVWLDQLSKTYGRAITKLDQIPDEELDRIAQRHFTALWLIGVWERSHASLKIKQMTGNPEAVASAYSLYDYDIAADLGGDEAFYSLRWRAWQRGIRLAGDMVPNHVGIYSRWVIEHPEYFVQSSHSPFPNYRFTGENLSEHPGVELRIEDGYWSRSDAAVVFQRIDRSNGQISYIYHGNDGTNMPWNDTAQLDFLRNEVREAVIGAIFRVAGKCSIIRFDAAMVLAKKHFQRLWYPEPGTGGAIPSRADYALSRRDFDVLFPKEFWREVVDRINAELPNTLLLAEAFWLLEGYFVRTLGMHRVYNSAFMHMFMKEENANYRELIRNTLQYNPEILKRYVNFMSNPDEKTAVEQFGKGDKYFGVATMMVTLPGLPMFAHGQIEGFSEKYGMEYRRAYYDERPDEGLVLRHEQILVPLLRKRYLFSGVAHFEMYDFVTAGGSVDENVFAFSNKTFSERALVFYHNKYAETEGWIRMSCGKVMREGDEDLRRSSLADALTLRGDENLWYVFRDSITGLEFLRPGKELRDRGWFMRLRAFEHHVFLDIQEVWDSDGSVAELFGHIGHNGAHDLRQMAARLRMRHVHQAFSGVVHELHARRAALIRAVKGARPRVDGEGAALRSLPAFVNEVNRVLSAGCEPSAVATALERLLESTGEAFRPAAGRSPTAAAAFDRLCAGERDHLLLLVWLLSRSMAPLTPSRLLHDLQLADAYRAALHTLPGAHDHDEADAQLLTILLEYEPHADDLFAGFIALLDRPAVQRYINVHAYGGVQYYHKESMQRLIRWCGTARAGAKETEGMRGILDRVRQLEGLSDRAAYRIAPFRELLQKAAETGMPSEKRRS